MARTQCSSVLVLLVVLVGVLFEAISGEENKELAETGQDLPSAGTSDTNILRSIRSPGKKKNKNRKKTKKTRKIQTKKKSKKQNKTKRKNIRGKKKNRKNKKRKTTRNKVKLRKQKRRKQHSQRKGVKSQNKQSTSTCRTSESLRVVSDQCLEDAMFSLAYEKNQVTNYIKQGKRLENHGNIASNKLNKKDEFSSAAKHMLWAIGGNLSDPKCGMDTNDKTRQERLQRGLQDSLANYNKLLNCTNSIREACDITLKNDTYKEDEHAEKLTECRKYKKDFIKVSKECVSAKDQANATLQCECWAKAAKDVKIIKTLKCETKSQQKLVTQHKNSCIKAFGTCKKMEDAAIELIHVCMHDHSNEFINQTAQGLHEAAEKSGRAMLKSRLAELGLDF